MNKNNKSIKIPGIKNDYKSKSKILDPIENNNINSGINNNISKKCKIIINKNKKINISTELKNKNDNNLNINNLEKERDNNYNYYNNNNKECIEINNNINKYSMTIKDNINVIEKEIQNFKEHNNFIKQQLFYIMKNQKDYKNY